MAMQPQNPYDFAHTANQPPRPSVLNTASKTTRILIVVGGGVGLLIIALILIAVLKSSGNASKQNLITAAQQQAELIRVSKLGKDRARNSAAKNLAVTVNLSLQSDQTVLLAELKKQGIKLGSKELAAAKKPATDTLLTNAEQSNKFDTVFIQAMQLQLKQYEQTLNTAYQGTSNKKLQDVLKQEYVNSQLLVSVKQ